MKTGWKVTLAVAAVVVAAGVVVIAARGPRSGDKTRAADPAAVPIVKVSRGDLQATVTASGQLQPNTITTVRPDSNMPTRKLVKLFVKEGDRVKAGQPLAEVDPSGLDLDLASARANVEAQKAKLANLLARPADLDLAAAEASLATARNTQDSAQESYANTKSLFDKGLAAKKDLADAERALQAAAAAYTSARLNRDNVKAQNTDADIQAQRSAVASAESDLQKSQLIYDSAVIRSPVAGVVAEIPVLAGDLISPSTALMTVVDPDPMWLQAQVNETDMGQVRIGERAVVTPSGFPDLRLPGKVTQIDLHAQVVSNVSVFTTTIEVPNHDGRLLWGMNADADISVLDLKNVLLLPASAIRTTGGVTTVTILDEGKQVAWEVQTGATDGTRTQIVAGLDEGTEVVSNRRTPGAVGGAGGPGGPPMGQVFRILH